MMRTNMFTQNHTLVKCSRAHWTSVWLENKKNSLERRCKRKRKMLHLYTIPSLQYEYVHACEECHRLQMLSNRIYSHMVVHLIPKKQKEKFAKRISNMTNQKQITKPYPYVFSCGFVVSFLSQMFCHIHGTGIVARINSCENADGSLSCDRRGNFPRTHYTPPIYFDGIAYDA